jgi:DNA (cytosine-5)-methyltransferase 1
VSLTVGSLFTGIGGFDLGLEYAGMKVRWQCEIDPYCRRVLAKHWPNVPCFEDITTLDTKELGDVDLICGGFPCQDISRAGRRAGLDGAKSGLWSEFRRVVGDVLPLYVLVENSTSITRHGLDRVLGDLHSLGYDAEWDCLPAAAFGAPHIRDRLYLLAYARSGRHRTPHETVFAGWTSAQLHGGWTPEPRVARVADGVPCGVDRRRALGNAVVPAVAEWIGRRILEADAAGERAA